MSPVLTAPQPLTATHHSDDFCWGEPILDEWLKRGALANQSSGASRTLVVVNRNGHVFGYYTLAAGVVAPQLATGNVRRKMPDPIPVMVLARLAIDKRARGIKLGGALLLDAINRTVAVSRNAGVRALLVHALHERAKAFYEHYGFTPSPVEPMTLMLRLNNPPVAAL